MSESIFLVPKSEFKKEIEEAIAAGARFIGENRVQEAKNKFLKIKKDNPKIELTFVQ